jgi:Leucine-rich repeat (LRR) protein
MSCISSFENLKSLALVSCSISEIITLKHIKNLEEIWLNQNLIRKIEGLENCSNLKKIFISDNAIQRIEGLEGCEKLEVLWLNENQIESLQGLSKLTTLKQAHLARNKVSRIGSCLSNLRKLEDLNLSGNYIGSFKEILNLTPLPSLKVLCFNDPNYSENPVCNLCNYQTYMLYHIPQLLQLDTFNISEEAKNYAEATFMKKKMYYNMRIKTIKRTASNIKQAVTTMVQRYEKQVFDYLRPIEEDYLMSEREIEERENIKETIGDIYRYGENQEETNPLDNEDQALLIQAIQTKKILLSENILVEYGHLKTLEHTKHALRSKIETSCKENISRLITELETGGNIRFEEGKSSDNWYTSCADLVSSRYTGKNLCPLKVTRVTRIHNRFLRNRFEERLESLVDITDPNYKKNLEYLFYAGDINEDLSKVIEEGFRTPEEYLEIGLPGCIPLVNSVLTAEIARLRTVDPSINKIFLPSGHLLICKVFIGENAGKLTTYTGELSVSEIWEKYPFKPSDGKWAEMRQKEDDSKQKVWFICDNSLVLPEYLVEFEYTDFEINETVFTEVETGEIDRAELTALNLSLSAFTSICSVSRDDRYDPIEPFMPAKTKVQEINSDVIEKVSREKDFSKITSINLSLNNVSSLKKLRIAYNLQKINLSFNKIENLDDLKCLPSLTHLYLSHNKVTSLIYFKEISTLLLLDLSHNEINSIIEVLHLSSNKSMQSLTLIGNPLSSHSRYRQLLMLSLPSLTELDCSKIPLTEKESYCQCNNKITLEMARSHAILSDSSGLLSAGEFYMPLNSFNKIRNDWASAVEVLQLNYQKLGSLSGIEYLPNLKKASFIGNIIMEISSVDQCRNLEELSLEDNLLTKIQNLDNLVYLKKLDLGRNFIKKIEGLNNLECLTQLSLEDNLINSLNGVEVLSSIMELYIGNNKLENLKEISLLKELPKLIILDISGNSLIKEPDSRLHIIFNLKRLKVLDGVGIEQSEQAFAKETFGGRLTKDLLESKLGGLLTTEIKVLDLSNAKLRSFNDMFTSEVFPMVQDLNLSGNYLQTLKCFGSMPRLLKLQLSRNRIDTLYSGDGKGLEGLPNLETLDLSFNNIQTISGLQTISLQCLKILVLAHNQIYKIEGLDNFIGLRELDISANSIKQIDFNSFQSPLSLRFLRLDDNRLRSLVNLSKLMKLQCLQIVSNRIQDFIEVERLRDLPNLMELVLSNNPVVRKVPYRLNVIKRLPQLMFLDAQEITNEERERVDLAQESKPPPLVHLVPQPTQKVPVKLTSVNFDAVFTKAIDGSSKRPSSGTALQGVIGVTALTSHLKAKNLKPRK